MFNVQPSHFINYQISGMSLNKKYTFFSVVAALVVGHAAPALAQLSGEGQDLQIPPQPAKLETSPLRLELSTSAQSLSAGFGNWHDVTLRGVYGLASHTLQTELSQNQRFGQNGSFLGVSDTYTINDDWFSSLSVGAGDGAFYLPRYRMDAALSRKWFEKRNLVTSLGLGYYKAPDGHTDRSVSAGLVYYFESPWIVEGGVRLNSSNPGSIRTQQQFFAATYGHEKQDLVTLRYGWGGEGYLAITANTQLVNFHSREASLAWRHWINPSTGILGSANGYTNPSYNRTGLTVGVFHNF